MSDFKAKMHKIRFPLGKLTAFPHSPQPISNGRKGEEKGERRGKGKERWGRREAPNILSENRPYPGIHVPKTRQFSSSAVSKPLELGFRLLRLTLRLGMWHIKWLWHLLIGIAIVFAMFSDIHSDRWNFCRPTICLLCARIGREEPDRS